MTWRELDVMDRARRVFFWDLVASLKSAMFIVEGVEVDPDQINPERLNVPVGEKQKAKPSEVGLDGYVRRGSD